MFLGILDINNTYKNELVSRQLTSQLPGPMDSITYGYLSKLPPVVQVLLLTSTGAREIYKTRVLYLHIAYGCTHARKQDFA
jgi:hypothetical protein